MHSSLHVPLLITGMLTVVSFPNCFILVSVYFWQLIGRRHVPALQISGSFVSTSPASRVDQIIGYAMCRELQRSRPTQSCPLRTTCLADTSHVWWVPIPPTLLPDTEPGISSSGGGSMLVYRLFKATLSMKNHLYQVFYQYFIRSIFPADQFSFLSMKRCAISNSKRKPSKGGHFSSFGFQPSVISLGLLCVKSS